MNPYGSTPMVKAAEAEAIAQADAALNNAGLPTYSVVCATLAGLASKRPAPDRVFVGADWCDNVQYIVVGERVYLTNRAQTPLALSNITDNAFALELELRQLRDSGGSADAMVKVINAATGRQWAVRS